jgi:lipoprotein-anchoring transpeptidase ErfK/SrfK
MNSFIPPIAPDMRMPIRRLLACSLLACALPNAWAAGADFGNVNGAVDGKPLRPVAVAKPAVAKHADPIELVDGQPAARSLLRAQILLERAHFSPGEIDAGDGSNTARAIAAFQRANGFAGSGKLDDATWSALDADDAPTLGRYTVTDADVAGPYVAIPGSMLAKAKLKKLGYGSIDEMLGERFHSSPTLLHRLNPGKAFVAGAELLVPKIDAAPLAAPSRVLVLGDDYSVNLVDADGRIYARFPATYGSVHDPLPVGDWDIRGVWRNPTYHYNPALFWDGNRSDPKATIQPGPNNPVGVAWISLSKPHVGIHGTPEPARISKTQSHGCIRLTNWSVLQVAAAVGAGTPVMISETMPPADAMRTAAMPIAPSQAPLPTPATPAPAEPAAMPATPSVEAPAAPTSTGMPAPSTVPAPSTDAMPLPATQPQATPAPVEPEMDAESPAQPAPAPEEPDPASRPPGG